MTDVTRILSAVEQGDRQAAAQLLPLVYKELRKLAAKQLAEERPGQTLQATALVHEAYLRLVGPADADRWKNRGHFFAAAGEAMRRILVDNARRKRRTKRGGKLRRVELDDTVPAPPAAGEDLVALDEALTRLAVEDAHAAAVVQVCYFAGLSVEEAAESLGMSRTTAYRHWRFVPVYALGDVRPERDFVVVIDGRVASQDPAADRDGDKGRDDRAQATAGELFLPVQPGGCAVPVIVIERPRYAGTQQAVLDLQGAELERLEDDLLIPLVVRNLLRGNDLRRRQGFALLPA